MTVELHKPALDFINEKFNVLFASNCRVFDLNLEKLSNSLDSINRDIFSPLDRILLVHMDTDYYDPLMPCGLLVTNIIRMFKNKKIPFYLLLFVTNHYGIKKEFDLLLEDQDVRDRPTIIETLLSPVLLSNTIDTNFNFNFNLVEKAGLCMLGKKRSHRLALCNFLKNNNLLSNVALKTNFK